MAIDLDGYNTVPERIAEFREKYPRGSLQPANLEVPYRIENVGNKTFIVFVAAAYRDADDQKPGIGTAWEIFPGPTNFTRDSELQNAETSAWGRAIVAALAADAKKGIASREDVQNRTADLLPPEPTINLFDYVKEQMNAEQWALLKEQWMKDYPFSVYGVPPSREQEMRALIDDHAASQIVDVTEDETTDEYADGEEPF